MEANPKLVAQALAILQNSSHHGLVVVAITADNQVAAVAVSERFTDMAMDAITKAAATSVRDALKEVAKVTRQTRQN